MQYFIMSLGLAFVVAILAVQNAHEVTIVFFTWSLETSLVLVILSSLVLGVILALSLAIPIQIRNKMELRKIKTKLAELETENYKLKTRLGEAGCDINNKDV
ncbi:MAG: hypothetical protein H6Q67_202 [Firmicutes bacterium]|nr:hypothetical protein [Bacillota bacterium]